MVLLVLGKCFHRTRDDVQVRFRPDEKPRMSSVAKRLGDGRKSDYLLVEIRAHLQIADVEREVIDSRCHFVSRSGGGRSRGEGKQEGQTETCFEVCHRGKFRVMGRRSNQTVSMRARPWLPEVSLLILSGGGVATGSRSQPA
jgi:hypothetical protein